MSDNLCMFCDEPTDGALICGSEECQRYDREMGDYLRSERRANWRAAVLSLLKQRCKKSTWHHLSRAARWFYTVKGLVCLLLLREGDVDKADNDPIDGITWNVHSTHCDCGSGTGWTELKIGWGLFTNWRYEIIEDSDI